MTDNVDGVGEALFPTPGWHVNPERFCRAVRDARLHLREALMPLAAAQASAPNAQIRAHLRALRQEIRREIRDLTHMLERHCTL